MSFFGVVLVLGILAASAVLVVILADFFEGKR